MSESTSHDVNASFDAMVAKGSAHFDNGKNYSSSESDETIWEVSIDFEDKRNLSKEFISKQGSQEDRLLSYIKDFSEGDYTSLAEVEEFCNLLDTEIEICTDPDLEAGFNSLKAVSKLFLWRMTDKKNERLLDFCIYSGFKDSRRAVELDPSNREYWAISASLDLVKDYIDEYQEMPVEDFLYIKKSDHEYNLKQFEDATFCLYNKEVIIDVYEDTYNWLISTVEQDSKEKENSSDISETEQEYLNEVKDCLADGGIGPRERRLLDKIREKLDITPERASELEKTLSESELTDEEKEYMTEFKECAIDGVVSDKERHLLEKMRTMLNISEERAKELERM